MRKRILFVNGIVVIFVFAGLLGFFWSRMSPAQQLVEKTPPLPLAAETETKRDTDGTAQSPPTILFAGDIMFDRYIRTQSEKFGKESIFAGVRSKLLAGDGVVANLEGPITLNASKSVGSALGESRNYIFTFDPLWAKTLFDANIRIVNIGNNHILNFGESGLVETRRFLRDAGVKFFGDPLDETLRTYVADIRGKKVGFVNYNQFSSDAEHRALTDIERLRSSVDVLFVYTHWGVEYAPATSEEKRLAHLFIDRGVDAVIGSHPHVVQEHELYRGKAIYYSLGNFVFDQYFSSETTHGLMVEALIAPDNTISFQEIPLKLSLDGKTSIAQ
ncbi:MAG: CapA family protein [Candidatus Moraniibacteriota bacterium]|nr:MAG: CapA family protein [Candidatus Moranbacteria bacterium]